MLSLIASTIGTDMKFVPFIVTAELVSGSTNKDVDVIVGNVTWVPVSVTESVAWSNVPIVIQASLSAFLILSAFEEVSYHHW